jgi:hypothetical protein
MINDLSLQSFPTSKCFRLCLSYHDENVMLSRKARRRPDNIVQGFMVAVAMSSKA